MNKCPEWIGQRPAVVCARFKKYLVLQPWQTALQIDFRFERVYVVREGNTLLLKDGGLLQITFVYTNGKALVGRDDPYQLGLDYSDDAKAFLAAIQERAVLASLEDRGDQ